MYYRRTMVGVVFCSVVFLISSRDGLAQVKINDANVTSTYNITDEAVAYGDIVSFDKESNTYSLSRLVDDKKIFGVVAEQSVILFYRKDGSIPVVQSGEVLLNVTTLNGPILVGDDIVTSVVLGKGQKANASHLNIVAVAHEAFTGVGATSITTVEGKEVAIGQVRATLSIGSPRVSKTLPFNIPLLSSKSTAPTMKIFQYLIAAIVAIGSVYISFKNFMPNISEGIASIGRNPRAKKSIQAIVVLNAALVVLISAAGFVVSVIIILLPI